MSSKQPVNIIVGSDYKNQDFKKKLINYLHSHKIIGKSYDVCIDFNKDTSHINEVCGKILASNKPLTFGVIITTNGVNSTNLANYFHKINCALILKNNYMIASEKPINCFSIDSRYSTIKSCAVVMDKIISNYRKDFI